MVRGEERLFITDILPSSEKYTEFFLKYLNIDSDGLKMKGIFPVLWEQHRDSLKGPIIFDDENLYKVAKVDYKNKLIWLKIIPENNHEKMEFIC